MTEIVEAGHLGGYVRHGDPNTLYPALFKWFRDDLGVRSVIDVGCGDGAALDVFAGLFGVKNVLGVEGVPQDHPRIICHDYTTGPYVPDAGGSVFRVVRRQFDLCWSAEFVEHVCEGYVDNFLATFASARMVAMTHAIPGQAGYHHMNCQPDLYWIQKLDSIGYYLDLELMWKGRKLVPPESYFAKTGMIFRRC